MKTLITIGLIMSLTSVASAEMIARYSFQQDVNDSAGKHHGQLKGTARISDGKLILDGKGWVELPGGLVTPLQSATVEAWFSYQKNGDWVRVFDFGNTNDEGLGAFCWYFTPDCPAGARTVFSNTDPGYSYEETIDANTLPENSLTHLVVVYDSAAKQSHLYLNNHLIGTKDMTVKLSDIGTEHLYLGKSSYNPDSLLKAEILEFRLYDTPLSKEQIEQNHQAGPDKYTEIESSN